MFDISNITLRPKSIPSLVKAQKFLQCPMNILSLVLSKPVWFLDPGAIKKAHLSWSELTGSTILRR